MVQAGRVLGGLEALLDRPPRASHPHQFSEGGAGRRLAGEERQLAASHGAADQQVTDRADGRDHRPVTEPGAFGAVAA
jgi:hypothetical protein